jgi:hypothetical protein
MKCKIILECSDALAVNFAQTEQRREFDYELREGDFVQFTYGQLRGQDGRNFLDDVVQFEADATGGGGLWRTSDRLVWSDLIVAFEGEEEVGKAAYDQAERDAEHADSGQCCECGSTEHTCQTCPVFDGP